jgi:hypothetical protein
VNNARARVRAKPEEPVHIVGVFLTPLPAADFRELSKCECECDRFIQVNYQSLADHVLQPVADMEMGYNARFLVDQYIRNLSYPDTVEELTSQDIAKGELVMAIGPKEKELLKGFFEQNESLFMAVFEAYKDSATPEFRAAIEEFEATRTGTRAAPDKPTSMKWGDGTPAPEVTSWKDVLREGIQKGIKLGVKIEDLKIDTYQDGNALRVPLEIAEGTFINAQLSARDIRRHVTNVLKASNAPAGLMKVTTIAGEVYELP